MLRLVAPAGGGVDEGPADVGRRARGQLHRAAQALGFVVREAGVGDDQAVDGAVGDGVELHLTTAAREIGAAGVGVEQGDAAEGGAVQVAVDAADVDEAALAGIARQRNARQAAEGFGGVEVGIFGDGLGRLHRDQVRRRLLLDAGLGFLAGGGDHDLGHPARRGVGRQSLAGHRQGAQGARAQQESLGCLHVCVPTAQLGIGPGCLGADIISGCCRRGDRGVMSP